MNDSAKETKDLDLLERMKKIPGGLVIVRWYLQS